MLQAHGRKFALSVFVLLFFAAYLLTATIFGFQSGVTFVEFTSETTPIMETFGRFAMASLVAFGAADFGKSAAKEKAKP